MKKSSHVLDSLKEQFQVQKQNNSHSKPATPTVRNNYNQNRPITTSNHLQQRHNANISLNMPSDNSSFSPTLLNTLNRYNGDQKRRIMWFFGEMVKNFSTQFTHIYGSEPDEDFAKFAADLEMKDFDRIVQHLRERLVAGKEWPPVPALLKIFKDLPLNEEILEARHNILVLKKPQNRTEKYIMKRKSSKIRSLSERNIAEEFRALYITAYEEVQRDLDLILDVQQEKSNVALLSIQPTDIDKEVDRRVNAGIVPKGKIGERLSRIEKLRKSRK